MIKEKNKLESVVIVKNNVGYVATVLYNNKYKSKYISANDKPAIYNLVERYVKDVENE